MCFAASTCDAEGKTRLEPITKKFKSPAPLLFL